MHNYYFVAASLPTLKLGEKPEISFDELESRLKCNLSQGDFEKVVLLRRLIDLKNIHALALGLPLEPFGNLNEKELGEALLVQDFLPAYVFDFLNRFETEEDRRRYFFGLIALYFAEEGKKADRFIKKYLTFERELRLVLLALRAKKLRFDLLYQLQFEDFYDPIVADILVQKDAADYMPPEDFVKLKEQLASCGKDPWQQQLLIEQYRFDRIEELSEYPLFSIDWILGYVARYLIAQRISELDRTHGEELLESFKTGTSQ